MPGKAFKVLGKTIFKAKVFLKKGKKLSKEMNTALNVIQRFNQMNKISKAIDRVKKTIKVGEIINKKIKKDN